MILKEPLGNLYTLYASIPLLSPSVPDARQPISALEFTDAVGLVIHVRQEMWHVRA